MKKQLIFLAILVSGVLGARGQGSESFTNVISAAPTDWTQLVALPKFNSTLGLLTSIDISVSSSMGTDIQITNRSLSPSSGRAKTEVQISLDNATYGNLFGQGGQGNAVLDYFSQPKFDYSLTGGQSVSSGTLTGSQSLTTGVITSPSVLSGFTGNGYVDLNAATTTYQSIVNTGGNSTMTQQTSAGLTTIITYDYTPLTPAPEPSSVAMMVAGLAGLGTVLRRRMAK